MPLPLQLLLLPLQMLPLRLQLLPLPLQQLPLVAATAVAVVAAVVVDAVESRLLMCWWLVVPLLPGRLPLVDAAIGWFKL